MNGYELSIKLVGQMILIMRTYLPNYEALKKSTEMREFGLFLADLQTVCLSFFDFSQSHAKFLLSFPSPFTLPLFFPFLYPLLKGITERFYGCSKTSIQNQSF